MIEEKRYCTFPLACFLICFMQHCKPFYKSRQIAYLADRYFLLSWMTEMIIIAVNTIKT